MGIEPTSQAWEARVLPLNYTRGGFISRKKEPANPVPWILMKLPCGCQAHSGFPTSWYANPSGRLQHPFLSACLPTKQ
jgi:hypothetical protein